MGHEKKNLIFNFFFKMYFVKKNEEFYVKRKREMYLRKAKFIIIDKKKVALCILKKMKHRKDRHWQNDSALSFVLLFIIIMHLDIIQFKLIVWTWVRVTFDWNVLSSKKEFHPTDVTAKLAVKEWFLI